MKDLKVSSETHSLLFSLKNKLALSYNKKFTYDEVVKFIYNRYWHSENKLRDNSQGNPLDNMYQLEEKP